jgi:hypothetical protein
MSSTSGNRSTGDEMQKEFDAGARPVPPALPPSVQRLGLVSDRHYHADFHSGNSDPRAVQRHLADIDAAPHRLVCRSYWLVVYKVDRLSCSVLETAPPGRNCESGERRNSIDS